MKLTLPPGSVEDLGGGVVRVTLPGASLSDATPEADAGSGDAGTSPDASRGDHAHAWHAGDDTPFDITIRDPNESNAKRASIVMSTQGIALTIWAGNVGAEVAAQRIEMTPGNPIVVNEGAISFAADGTLTSGYFIPYLETSNPGPGILWNDAGTVKVGT